MDGGREGRAAEREMACWREPTTQNYIPARGARKQERMIEGIQQKQSQAKQVKSTRTHKHT